MSAAGGDFAEVWLTRAWGGCIELEGERFSGLSLAVTGFDAAYNSKFALPELMLLTASFKRCGCFWGFEKMSKIVTFLVLFLWKLQTIIGSGAVKWYH